MPIAGEGLPPVRSAGPEREMLVEFLDYFRAVLRRKADGLTDEHLHRAVPPSSLTLGGLLRHMTMVEYGWFTETLQDKEPPEPWASAPWSEDHDWEFTTAPLVATDEIFRAYDEAIEASRAATAAVDSLDSLAARPGNEGEPVDLRWILLHMLEEYARHCGHADYLREAIDGVVGD